MEKSTRRKFSSEFKEEVVKLVTEAGGGVAPMKPDTVFKFNYASMFTLQILMPPGKGEPMKIPTVY